MGDGARAELSMLPNGAAPAHAREWLRDMLSGFGPSPEVLEDTILVVDELVTNAVVHAATPIVVALEYSPDRCLCSVLDRCVDGPLPRLVERADGTGRGLRLVRAIATAWGVERTAAGTTVWAEIGDYATST
jgi:anti-sigma regulatory factor (Ser/Thr protein kinase)